MLLAWKDHGIMTLAGYILGFPGDTPESIRRDIAILKRELPLDIVEFFCLTPLPGSEDHQVLWKSGIAVDPDLNNYDLEHVLECRPANGRASTAKPDQSTIHPITWRYCCGAPGLPALE